MTVVIDRTRKSEGQTGGEPVSAAGRVRAKAAGSSGLYRARVPIYPKLVHGRWRRIKWILLMLMLGIYWITPWLRWSRPSGLPQQAALVDFAGGRFYFGPIQLWPQEVYFITGLLVISAMGLFLVSALFGRLWCGYACPQTVWTDLFIYVERAFEGLVQVNRVAVVFVSGTEAADALAQPGHRGQRLVVIHLRRGKTPLVAHTHRGEALGALPTPVLHLAGDVQHGDAIHFAPAKHIGCAVEELFELRFDPHDPDIRRGGGGNQMGQVGSGESGRYQATSRSLLHGLLHGLLQCSRFCRSLVSRPTRVPSARATTPIAPARHWSLRAP